MGTRSAPLAFLLLAACMAADGTGPAVRDGGGAAPGATAAAPPAGLPAIPRMRPEPPRKTRPAGTAVAATGGAAEGTDGQTGGGAKAPKPSTGSSGAARESAPAPEPANTTKPADSRQAATGTTSSVETAGAPNADPDPPPDPAVDGDRSADPDTAASGAEIALLPGADASATLSGATSEPGPPPSDPAVESLSGTDLGMDGADSPDDEEATLAFLPPTETNPGIDVESLFDGDVVRYCAAMWRMGEYIGEARRRGDPFKQAIGNAVRRIAAEKQLPLDNRLAFSGQVYGRLVYRLEDSHAALTLGAYVHFACLTVRGDKKIVPADPNAERLLNSGLVRCESTAFTRDKLNDCIFRELTPIVDRRNS